MNNNINFWDEKDAYMILTPRMTGLKVFLCVDVAQGYKFHHHYPVSFIQNSYSQYGEDFIPVTVGERPKFINAKDLERLKIYYADLIDAIHWLRDHHELLMMAAKDEIDDFKFAIIIETEAGLVNNDDLQQQTKKRLTESQHLNEMAVFTKEESGLAFDLWLDQAMIYKKGKHWKRLKVQSKNGNRNTEYWPSYMFPTENTEGGFEKESEANDYKSKDIKALKQFIDANLDLLNGLADGTILFSEFQRECLTYHMIKLGKTRKTIDAGKIRLFDYVQLQNTDYMIRFKKDEQTGSVLFAITKIGKDDLLTDWYKTILPNTEIDSKGRYAVAYDLYNQPINLYISDLDTKFKNLIQNKIKK